MRLRPEVVRDTHLADYRTFRAIADECYHVYQDFSRSGQWRHETDDHLVEAACFADSLALPLRRFLEANRVFQR